MALLGCRQIALGMVTTAHSHDVKMQRNRNAKDKTDV
jgi:hypothetical protein